MHIPFIGPLVIIILFGIGLLVVYRVISKLYKKERIIMGSMDKLLKKMSGDNILIELVILLGVPFGAIYLLTFFSDENFFYWLIVSIEIAFWGYLGVKWLEN